MDFWLTISACVSQARQCIKLDHVYPEELAIHAERIQSMNNALVLTAESYLGPDSSEASRRNFISWQQILQQLLEDIEALHAEQAIVDNGGYSDNQHRFPYQLKVSVTCEFTSGWAFLQTDIQVTHSLLHAGYNRKEITVIAGISE